MESYIIDKSISNLKYIKRKFGLIGDYIFFKTRKFSWINELEQSYPIILDEFQSMMTAKHYMPSISELSVD